MPPASPFTNSPFDLVINPGQRAPSWPQVRPGQANQRYTPTYAAQCSTSESDARLVDR
ncbi:hypothetical protein M440DRAFT_1396248 [Trichoderma longibrachiatum ATCC 18648]|uniref:Uncharacterized protein n=1 Tax=Trichoderma longibrachiatum ATCC 18648 TaxID=983965 RepID=A0A2T4CHQ5_TRILO|nr:hypothetical protein M440DRAFT_1396248 [Trichoderma longibrachiatum ATCC 18648]